MDLIQAVCLTPAFDLLESKGANVDRHLHKSGLNAFSPRNPMSWLPKELVFRFIERLDRYELSDTPVEDLESAYRLRNTHHYGRYLLSAPNMLAAARRATNPRAAVMTYHRTGVGVHRTHAKFQSRYDHSRGRQELIIEGLSLVLMLDALAEYGGPNARLATLDITLDSLPDTTLPLDLSKTKIRTKQPMHAATFPLNWLARRLRTRMKNPESAMWSDHAGFSENLESLLDALEPGKLPKLEYIADCTGVPVRTIQRKLADENTSFFELLEKRGVRQALAALQSPASAIKDVSDDLGYSNPAHFTRAFRRWMGQSPKAYRDTAVKRSGRRDMAR